MCDVLVNPSTNLIQFVISEGQSDFFASFSNHLSRLCLAKLNDDSSSAGCSGTVTGWVNDESLRNTILGVI